MTGAQTGVGRAVATQNAKPKPPMRDEMNSGISRQICTYSLAVLLACMLALVPVPGRTARAETFSFAAAMQAYGQSECFRWVEGSSGTVGLQRLDTSGCEFQHVVMPLYWKGTDPSTNHTIRVRGRLNDSSAQIGCSAFVVDANGFVRSSASGWFSTVGSYSWLELTVNNVTATTTGYVTCNPTHNAYLSMIEFDP